MPATLPADRESWLRFYHAELAQARFDLATLRGYSEMSCRWFALEGRITVIEGKIATLEEYSAIGTNYYPIHP